MKRRGRTAFAVSVAAVMPFVVVGELWAVEPQLVRCTPPNVLAAYWLDPPRPDPDASTTESGSLVAYMVESAQHMGLLGKLDPAERAWLDGFALLSVLRNFPHGVLLLDIRSETRDDGGEQLSGIRAALMIQTHGRNALMERTIQHWLHAYTNNEESKLDTEKSEDGDVFTLRDHRLPSWAPITWGPVRSMYVVTIGTDVFPTIASRVRTVEDVPADSQWFTNAFKMAKGNVAGFALYLNIDAIHGSANSTLHEKITDVQGGLHLSGTQRALWTLGSSDRSIEVRAVRRVGGQDVVNIVADSGFLDRFGADVVPKEATRFAIIDWNPTAAFETVCETSLAVQSSPSRRASLSFWKDVQSESGVRVGEDIFSRMGSSLLVHNYPTQAFGLPLGLTFVAPVGDDPARLRASVDRLLSHLDTHYLALGGCYRFRKEPDGVWAIDFGLKGPAVVITDDWVVLSFSPYAVRENLSRLPKRGRAVSLDPRTDTR